MPEESSRASQRRLDLVAGARPNFMKLASVYRAMQGVIGPEPRIVHTGQHHDPAMSDVFFEQLDLPEPFTNLGVGSGSHGVQTAQILERYERHLQHTRPAATVVFGDVNSTVACALAAAKLEIPVIHIEAGLRSHDRRMPEEINRVVTDHLASLLLVTEQGGMDQLQREGIAEERSILVGNTMIDTLLRFVPRVRARRRCREHGLEPGAYALLTLHRPGTVDQEDVLRGVLAGVARLAGRLPIVFPIHPRTRARMSAFDITLPKTVPPERLIACPPEPYLESLSLISDAALVLTDSGGMQQEAAALGVPCAALRETTEHLETLRSGACRLVGTEFQAIGSAFEDAIAGRWVAAHESALWDGRAGERAAAAIARFLTGDPPPAGAP